MKNTTTITDCVEFKNELHKKLYVKSGAKDFAEYIKYVNALYSDKKTHQSSVSASQRGRNYSALSKW